MNEFSVARGCMKLVWFFLKAAVAAKNGVSHIKKQVSDAVVRDYPLTLGL